MCRASDIPRLMPRLDRSLCMFLQQIAVSVFFSVYILTCRALYYYDHLKYAAYLKSPNIWFEAAGLGAVIAFVLHMTAGRLNRENMPGTRLQIAGAAVLFAMISASFFLLKFEFSYDRLFILCLNNTFAAVIIFMSSGITRVRLKHAPGQKTDKKGPDRAVVVIFLAVITTVIFQKTFSFHQAFYTQAKDAGIYFNAMWNIINSHSQFTCADGYLDHRGVHFQPMMYLFAPLMLLKDDGAIFFFLQAFFLGLSGFYMYLLSVKLLKNKHAAFLIMLAYCISPYFFRITDYNFKFSSIYAAAFLAMLYHAERGEFIPSVAAVIAAICVKEEAALYTGFILVFLGLRKNDTRYYLLSAAIFIYFAVVTFLVIPAYNPGNSYFSGWITDSIMSIKPFFNTAMLKQLVFFLAGVLFLALYPSSAFVLILLPPLIVQTAAYTPVFLIFFFYHSAMVTPALFATAMYNYEKISRVVKEKNPGTRVFAASFLILILQTQYHIAYAPLSSVTGAALACVMFLSFPYIYLRVKTPVLLKQSFIALSVIIIFLAGYAAFYNARLDFIPPADREAIREAMKLLPEDKNIPVIANTNTGTHISDRKYVDFIESEIAFRAVTISKSRVFYLLENLKSNTYSGMNSAMRDREFAETAVKNGFKGDLIFSKDLVWLYKFVKAN